MVDLAGYFARRFEIALQNRHFSLARKLVDLAEVEITAPPPPITRSTSLCDIGLPVRLINILDRAGIVTIGDVLQRTPAEISELPAVGVKSVRLVFDTLRSLSITNTEGDKDAR